jgi:L-lactate utilization protein LutC
MAPQTSDRYTALPTEAALAETAGALERRGFGVDVVADFDAARRAVLARIPEGASVMTYPSVTLEETGIARAIDASGRYDSARVRGLALDRATQMAEIKTLMLQPDFALGSVHAITRDGTLVLASALGSQVAAHAWGAGRVIFAVGAQKLVPDLDAARERIRKHCLELESARALAAYGEPSRIGKILEIHGEDPGRIHVVLIRQRVGF